MIPKRLGPPAGEQTYFVTSNTLDRRSIFQVEAWARIFFKNLYHYRKEGKYLLHGFVLMQEHFHVLMTPQNGVTLEQAVQAIKGGCAFRLKEAGRKGSPVWQKGFSDRRIRDAQEYAQSIEYIHQNPVKACKVSTPDQYPYCSAYPGWKLDPPRPYLSG